MSTVNGFQVGSETLKYNYESLENYNTLNFSSSSSKVYAIGDYVMYNGKLYKCTTATTGGTWNVNNWAEAILTDDVTEQKNAIDDLYGADATETGETVTVESEMDMIPVKQISTEFTFSQSGEGDPSPTNIRPIIGLKECTVINTGENSQQNSITINWQDRHNEIYGATVIFNDDGSVDLVRKYHIVPVSNWTWTKVTNSDYRNFYVTPITYPPKYDANIPTVISSHYKSVSSSSGTTASGDNYIWIWNNNGAPSIAIKDTSKATLTAAQFKAAIADVQIVYELKTPVTLHYNNIGQLMLYLGENTISASTGNVTVKTTSLVKGMNSYTDYSFNRMKATIEASRMGLHTVPSFQGQANVIRRARQLTDIKWTSPVDLARHMYTGNQRWQSKFSAGVEYTGIPYGESDDTVESRYGYPRLSVGLETSVDTFVTAVSCKDAIIAKEDVGSAASHQSVVYACACDALVCYALNITYATAPNIPNKSDIVTIGKVLDNGTRFDSSVFQLCDILGKSSHIAIITDIVRDDSGNVISIEVSEETSTGEAIVGTEGGQVGGLARRRGYDIDYFYEHWADYTVYRYNYQLMKSVPYTPSAYVDTGGELNKLRYDRLPCMPYEGDKFKYKTGYIPNSAVKILIEATVYDYLRVYKNGTEISGSPFVVGENDEYVNVTEISAGDYSAHLCTMSGGEEETYSEPCHWSIVS